MRSLLVGSALISLAIAPSAQAVGLKQRLAKMPSPAFTSEKPLGELEYCIGLETARWMHPNTLRGDKKVILYGTPEDNLFGLTFFAVVIQDTGSTRTIAYQAQTSWDERTAALIRACM